MSPDHVEVLHHLNSNYIRSVAEADTSWFDLHLAQDFLNTNPDGTRLDRDAFIEQIGRGSSVTGLVEHDVLIRIFDDHAVIHARTRYTKPDGAPGAGFYTDDWHLQDGQWKCVAAHVSRG